MSGRRPLHGLRWLRWAAAGPLLLAMAAFASWVSDTARAPEPQRFSNPYVVPEHIGARVPGTYFLRRAWLQITRDLTKTEVPPTAALGLAAMAQRPFAVSRLGHSAMLMRVSGLWVLFTGWQALRGQPFRGG